MLQLRCRNAERPSVRTVRIRTLFLSLIRFGPREPREFIVRRSAEAREQMHAHCRLGVQPATRRRQHLDQFQVADEIVSRDFVSHGVHQSFLDGVPAA